MLPSSFFFFSAADEMPIYRFNSYAAAKSFIRVFSLSLPFFFLFTLCSHLLHFSSIWFHILTLAYTMTGPRKNTDAIISRTICSLRITVLCVCDKKIITKRKNTQLKMKWKAIMFSFLRKIFHVCSKQTTKWFFWWCGQQKKTKYFWREAK